MARANHAKPTRGGHHPWGHRNPKNQMFAKLTVRPPHPFQCIIMTLQALLMNVKSTQPLWSDSAKFHFGGLTRVMPTAGGVGVVGAGHGLWGASNDYSTPIFAPELAKHDPFRHPRAMVVVWVALHVPVQVLPHDLPTEAHGDPPSRSSVTCQ